MRDGKPIPVFHGTMKKFTKVKRQASERNEYGNGIYFTETGKEASDDYASFMPGEKHAEYGSVHIAFLNIQNPCDVTNEEHGRKVMAKCEAVDWKVWNGISYSRKRITFDFAEVMKTDARTQSGHSDHAISPKDWYVKLQQYLMDQKASTKTMGINTIITRAGFDGLHVPANKWWIAFKETQVVPAFVQEMKESEGKVYFHGTGSNFDKFTRKGTGKHGVGFYFTPKVNEAKYFAKSLYGAGEKEKTPRLLTVRLSFSKPYNTMSVEHAQKVASHFGHTYRAPKAAGGPKEHYHHLELQLKRAGVVKGPAGKSDLNDKIKEAGFDAVEYDFMGHVIVFDEGQIEIQEVELLDSGDLKSVKEAGRSDDKGKEPYRGGSRKRKGDQVVAPKPKAEDSQICRHGRKVGVDEDKRPVWIFRGYAYAYDSEKDNFEVYNFLGKHFAVADLHGEWDFSGKVEGRTLKMLDKSKGK